MKPTIFVDLDGVLANWVDPALQALGYDPVEIAAAWDELNPRPWDLFDVVGMERSEGYHRLEIAGERFWAELPILPHAKWLVTRCQAIGETTIFTAPFTHPSSYVGKVQWLDRHFGRSFARKHALIGGKKHVVARPGALLIDDRPSNCEAWEREGGTAILFPAIGNRLHAQRSNAMEFISLQLTAYAKDCQND